MNNKIKTVIFKCLDILPARLGYFSYHFLQNFTENKNIENKLKSTQSTFNSLIEICDQLGIIIKEKSVLEIGSGWLPIIPYFLRFQGKVAKVYTYDLNKHYQKNGINSFNSLFSKKFNLEIKPDGKNYNLHKDIVYYPNQNIINCHLPDVDVVFSRFVLEHVTPKDLLDLHKKFKSTLKKDTYIIHFISPSDHRAYSDKNMSMQDFLRYSEKEWNYIQTKFDYHNRLRLPEYLEIFKSLGYEVVYLDYNFLKEGSLQYEKFKKIQLNEKFSKYTTEQLTAGSINIVLKT
jgi:cyclopropane fatty-acyl-phospholipid synthase-like methyltransferase